MNQIIILVVVYVSYLLIWGLICLLSFALALVFKKPAIMHAVTGITQLIVGLLNFLIGGWLLIYAFSLLFSGQILWFIVMIFIGIGIVTWFLSLIQMPFTIIPMLFSQKIEDIEKESDVVKVEILDEHHKVVGVIEGEKAIDRRLAIYFIVVYGLNLLSIFMSPTGNSDYLWGDYLLSPFLWIISEVLFFGFIIGIYQKIRRGKFFYPRKKVFLVTTLKINAIILVILSTLLMLLGIWKI